MKPIRSFLFLAGILGLFLIAGGVLEWAGYGNFLPPFPKEAENGETPGLFAGKEAGWSRGPDRETESLQARWAQDSVMDFYRRLYRLDPDIFSDAGLQGIPLTPFEYDSARTGKTLLDDFFARLLRLRNPAFEKLLRQWYSKPGFWDEPLAGNREHFTRILHYGDKQIENDRITSTLRRFFQEDFGGSGPGLLPLFQARHDLHPEISGPWHKVESGENTRKGNFGVHTAYLTAQPLDALLRPGKTGKGRILFPLPGQNPERAAFLDLIVHADLQASDLELQADGRPIAASPQTLSAYSQKRLTYPLPPGTGRIRLDMALARNHALYAAAVNDTIGISVDNIALDGKTASVFTPNNRRFLTDQFNLLNVGLILYQTGIEPPSSMKGLDYGYYRMLLMQDLSYIRAQMPGIPVIVIGIPDLPLPDASSHARSEARMLREIGKEVAFQTGCIYWDFYQAMGGENSLSRWAAAKPALASASSALLTEKGAEMAGKLFYKALLDAYRDFLLRERKKMMMERAKQLQSISKSY